MLLGTVDVTSSDITRQQRREIDFSPEVTDQDSDSVIKVVLDLRADRRHFIRNAAPVKESQGFDLRFFFVAPEILAI